MSYLYNLKRLKTRRLENEARLIQIGTHIFHADHNYGINFKGWPLVHEIYLFLVSSLTTHRIKTNMQQYTFIN